jgi:hypothetical protein
MGTVLALAAPAAGAPTRSCKPAPKTAKPAVVIEPQRRTSVISETTSMVSDKIILVRANKSMTVGVSREFRGVTLAPDVAKQAAEVKRVRVKVCDPVPTGAIFDVLMLPLATAEAREIIHVFELRNGKRIKIRDIRHTLPRIGTPPVAPR